MLKRGGISSPENSSLQYLPVVYPAAAARPESGLREVGLSDVELLKAVHGHFEVIVIAVGSHERVHQFLDLFHGRAFRDTDPQRMIARLGVMNLVTRASSIWD